MQILHKDICIECDISFSSLLRLKIIEQLNGHATAYISGVLHEQVTVEEMYKLNIDSNFRIKAMIDSEEEIIFAQ